MLIYHFFPNLTNIKEWVKDRKGRVAFATKYHEAVMLRTKTFR
jgi:hypothetical protein